MFVRFGTKVRKENDLECLCWVAEAAKRLVSGLITEWGLLQFVTNVKRRVSEVSGKRLFSSLMVETREGMKCRGKRMRMWLR